MFPLASIDRAVEAVQLIDKDILMMSTRIKEVDSCRAQNLELRRRDAADCRKKIYEHLCFSYIQFICIDKVLEDLQR